MTIGTTYTASVADSLPTWISSARQVKEFEGVMPQLVDNQYLGEGIGTTWNEVSFAQLTAQSVTELTDLENNPQAMSDTLLTVTPTIVGIYVLITDRVKQRISKTAFAQMGGLVQNAIQRKKDQDGITVLDGATTSLCGTGNTLTSGHITAATTRIRGNVTEPGPDPIYVVLHPYQIKDIQDELLNGVGTYNVDAGVTATVFQTGFKLPIDGAMVFPDGNITPDSTPDAKGGVFSKMGIILVQGRVPRVETKREPGKGGGADGIYHYDEYAYGERSSGNWLYEIYSDATAPTS